MRGINLFIGQPTFYDRTGGFDFVNTRIVDDTTLYAIWEFKNPVVSISSTGNSVTYGDKVTLTAVVTHGASIVEYAWFKKETSNIPVGTTQSITLSNVSQSGGVFLPRDGKGRHVI